MSGRVQPGSRVDVIIPRTHPAYCTPPAAAGAEGDVGRHICSYYITVLPLLGNCTSATQADNAPGCAATATVTATLLSATATVVLDYGSLKNKVTTLTAEAAPGKTSRYYLYTRSPSEARADVFLRMELCDAMAGFVWSYVCEAPYTAAGGATVADDGSVLSPVSGSPFCAVPRAPSPTDYQLALATTPDTDGGEGRGRLSVLGTPARQLYAAVTVPEPAGNYTAAVARFGDSRYELQVVLGNGWYLKQPTRDAIGAIKVTYSLEGDGTSAHVTWSPPLILNDSSVTDWNASAAVGVTYRVYVAARTFADSAARATNTSLGFAGVMPSTACGLERWATITGKNASVFTTTATGLTLGGLKLHKAYEVNVVAECDDNCLRANAARLGWASINSAISVQRIPYAVTQVRTPLPAAEDAVDAAADDTSPSGVVSVLAPIGVVLTFAVLGAAVFVMYKQAKAASAAGGRMPGSAGATAPLAPGVAGVTDSGMVAINSASMREAASAGVGRSVTVPREQADALFKPRDPSVRRAVFGFSPPAAAGGRHHAPAASEGDSMAASLAYRMQPAAAAPAAPGPVPVAYDAGAGAGAGFGGSPAARHSAGAPSYMPAAFAPQAPTGTTPAAPGRPGAANPSGAPAADYLSADAAGAGAGGRRGRAARGGAPVEAAAAYSPAQPHAPEHTVEITLGSAPATPAGAQFGGQAGAASNPWE
jgi:hypothetical protein